MTDPTRKDERNQVNKTHRDEVEPPISETVRDDPNPSPSGSPDRPDVYLQALPSALAADFSIVEALTTRGGEADLFIVKRISDDQLFVAKIYRYGITVKEDLLDLVAGADPDHVVRVVDHGQSDGRFFELQEYVALGSLVELISEEGPQLDVGLIKDVLHELLSAIRHLHEKGITHRDLKPANILVRTRNPLDLVLTDFGISSLMHDQSQRFTSGYQTITYSAPEADSGLVTPASDYWSLGMIIAEVVGGAHPYRGLSNEVIRSSKATRPVPLENIEGPWLKLCRGLLTRNPKMRWGADFIQRWLDDDSTIPEPVLEEIQVAGTWSVRPCRFLGHDYVSPEELAEAMSRNWEEGLKYLEKDYLHKWFSNDLPGGQELAVFVEDLEQETDWDGHAKLFRVIRQMNPGLAPSFRELVLNKANLALLADDAVSGDEKAQEIVHSLNSGRILETTAGWDQNGRLASIGVEWDQARREYDDLRQSAQSNGPGQPDDRYQTYPMRLGILLLGVLDEGFLSKLQRQTENAATELAREVKWFSDLGNPKTASPAALLLMKELQESGMNAARKQRREEEEQKQAELEEERKRIWKEKEEAVLKKSRWVMAVVSFVVGLIVVPILWSKVDYSSDSLPGYRYMALPGFATILGYIAGTYYSAREGRKAEWVFIGVASAVFYIIQPIAVYIIGYILTYVLMIVLALSDIVLDISGIEGDSVFVWGVCLAYLAIWVTINWLGFHNYDGYNTTPEDGTDDDQGSGTQESNDQVHLDSASFPPKLRISELAQAGDPPPESQDYRDNTPENSPDPINDEGERHKEAILKSRIVMLVVSLYMGFKIYTYLKYNIFVLGEFGLFKIGFAIGLPGLAIFAGVLTGEASLFFQGVKRKDPFKGSETWAYLWLASPVLVGFFAFLFPFVVFLVYGLARLFFFAPNIPLSWEDQRIISGLMLYLYCWWQGNKGLGKFEVEQPSRGDDGEVLNDGGGWKSVMGKLQSLLLDANLWKS